MINIEGLSMIFTEKCIESELGQVNTTRKEMLVGVMCI